MDNSKWNLYPSKGNLYDLIFIVVYELKVSKKINTKVF